MKGQKHIPRAAIPQEDLDAFARFYAPGDIFDDTAGPGAHLSAGTRQIVDTTNRRWLGYLHRQFSTDLELAPHERITPDRVRSYVTYLLSEMRPVSASICIDGLGYIARFSDPTKDWQWLTSIASRLRARGKPEDRFHKLVPGWQTLDYGIRLMDEALDASHGWARQQAVQYRNGMIIAVLSHWPIRRRSLAALTVDQHLEVDQDGITILLWPRDTKGKRAESCRIDHRLVPYIKRYLDEIRPVLHGDKHNGLWVSQEVKPLLSDRLSGIVRKHTFLAFGKAMELHDFRRAAATFLATDAPELVGLIPGILQQTNPEIGERHYNLSRSIGASRRFNATRERARDELRLHLQFDTSAPNLAARPID